MLKGRADLGRDRARAHVLHEPRIVVTKLMAGRSGGGAAPSRGQRFASAQDSLDEMLAHEHLSSAGEHRDVLEAYRMFAHDRGWERRLREAVRDAASPRTQRVERCRTARGRACCDRPIPSARERQRDLDDLSDRLPHILSGRKTERASIPRTCRPDTILIARRPWDPPS